MIIGITGYSGSGKTTFAEKLVMNTQNKITLISQDCYYKSIQEDVDIYEYNFDTIESLDIALINEHLLMLKNNIPTIKIPEYDFERHQRVGFQEVIVNKNIIIEGHMIFTDTELRDKLDLLIYIDTDSDISLSRRITRDIKERGRELNEILYRYNNHVKITHNELVMVKSKADIIIPNNTNFDKAFKVIDSYLKDLK